MNKALITFNFIVIIAIFTIYSVSCNQPDTTEGITTTTTILEVDNAVSYKCVGSDATYYVFINAGDLTRDLTIAEGLEGAICVVDAKQAGTDAIINPVGVKLSEDKKIVTLAPMASAIYKK